MADFDIHAGRSPSNAMLTPGAATSLVNSALGWLQGSTAEEFLSTDTLGSQESMSRLQAAISAYAAVVGFLNTHIHARQVTMLLLVTEQLLATHTPVLLAVCIPVLCMVLATIVTCDVVESDPLPIFPPTTSHE